MSSLVQNAEFWKALTALAWPIVALFLLIKFKPLIANVLQRENMQLKVGGLEISVQEAAKNAGKDIADLQLRLAKLEKALSEAPSTGNLEISDRATNVVLTKKLLWVDDVPANNAFLVEGLKQRGVDVVLSRNTADALQQLKVDTFGAIITDLGRYEDGREKPFAGLELIEKVRADQVDTPILVFASSRGMKNRDKLMQAGAEDVADSGVKVMTFVERHLGL